MNNYQDDGFDKEKGVNRPQLASGMTRVMFTDPTSSSNGTIIKDGEEFSFNKIAGNPTPDRGYKKAGVFIDGELKKGYGGGNCQVSTTIYNAVDKIDGIKVTERHEHGKEVGYIKMGKDSTVVYDGLDLKFENNTGYDIKLYAELSDKKIKVKVNKLK